MKETSMSSSFMKFALVPSLLFSLFSGGIAFADNQLNTEDGYFICGYDRTTPGGLYIMTMTEEFRKHAGISDRDEERFENKEEKLREKGSKKAVPNYVTLVERETGCIHMPGTVPSEDVKGCVDPYVCACEIGLGRRLEEVRDFFQRDPCNDEHKGSGRYECQVILDGKTEIASRGKDSIKGDGLKNKFEATLEIEHAKVVQTLGLGPDLHAPDYATKFTKGLFDGRGFFEEYFDDIARRMNEAQPAPVVRGQRAPPPPQMHAASEPWSAQDYGSCESFKEYMDKHNTPPYPVNTEKPGCQKVKDCARAILNNTCKSGESFEQCVRGYTAFCDGTTPLGIVARCKADTHAPDTSGTDYTAEQAAAFAKKAGLAAQALQHFREVADKVKPDPHLDQCFIAKNQFDDHGVLRKDRDKYVHADGTCSDYQILTKVEEALQLVAKGHAGGQEPSRRINQATATALESIARRTVENNLRALNLADEATLKSESALYKAMNQLKSTLSTLHLREKGPNDFYDYLQAMKGKADPTVVSGDLPLVDPNLVIQNRLSGVRDVTNPVTAIMPLEEKYASSPTNQENYLKQILVDRQRADAVWRYINNPAVLNKMLMRDGKACDLDDLGVPETRRGSTR
ncbi:unnamed protein product [Sphagnum balticum]